MSTKNDVAEQRAVMMAQKKNLHVVHNDPQLLRGHVA